MTLPYVLCIMVLFGSMKQNCGQKRQDFIQALLLDYDSRIPPNFEKDELHEDPDSECTSMTSTYTQFNLDEAAIKSIADALKNVMQGEMASMIENAVGSIVKGVTDGLRAKVSELQIENVALKGELSDLRNQVAELNLKADAAEQYSRRDSLRIYGVPEEPGEDTDTYVLNMAKAVGASIVLPDIAVSHRVGKPKRSKPRYILVKFVSRRSRDLVYTKRVLLKDKGYDGVFINEDLTRHRSELLFLARNLVKSRNILGAWFMNGIVYAKTIKDSKTSVHRIFSLNDLDPLKHYSIPETPVKMAGTAPDVQCHCKRRTLHCYTILYTYSSCSLVFVSLSVSV